jgi:hypothetical protein
MKLTITRYATRVTLFATVLLAICLFVRPANAQERFQGRFTLPFEAHWGQVVLPPGDFLLTFTQLGRSTVLVIQDAKSRRSIAYESLNVPVDSSKGESALLIGYRGGQRIVHTLRIAELGQVFVYDRALAREYAVQEARQTQAVPVSMAKK